MTLKTVDQTYEFENWSVVTFGKYPTSGSATNIETQETFIWGFNDGTTLNVWNKRDKPANNALPKKLKDFIIELMKVKEIKNRINLYKETVDALLVTLQNNFTNKYDISIGALWYKVKSFQPGETLNDLTKNEVQIRLHALEFCVKSYLATDGYIGSSLDASDQVTEFYRTATAQYRI